MSTEVRAVILGAVIAFIFIFVGLPVGWALGLGMFVTISTALAEKNSK